MTVRYENSHHYAIGADRGAGASRQSASAVRSSFKSSVPAHSAHVRPSSVPGPGEYDPNHGFEHGRPVSATMKGPERQSFIGPPKTSGPHVGPGSYEPQGVGSIQQGLFDKSRHQSKRKPGFGSSSARRPYWEDMF